MKNENVHPDILKDDQFETVRSLIGKIAHDFNNLLTPLVAYPQLIKTDLPEGSEGQELLDVMESTCRDMEHITRQLLLLSMINKDEHQLLNVNTLIKDIVTWLKEKQLVENITIECDLADDVLNINGSDEAVMTVLHNMYVNSAEAMADGGQLLIKTENEYKENKPHESGISVTPGMYVKVSMHDNGSGINDEIKDNVFLPFVTTKKGQSRRGAGLGLSIVYRTMMDHNGFIDFESSPGKGTTFNLYFPAVG
ncbi:nitrogen regulation protein NR(II) [Verrucomicrobiota bacterium]